MEIMPAGDIENLMCNVNSCETFGLKIYQSKILTDVNFKFVNEPTVMVKSHKLLLAFHSPVFNTMFYGPMAAENLKPSLDNSILIEDISSRIFDIILKYTYTFKVDTNFNHQDNLEILYVAKKYILKDLEKKILVVINASINVNNGCFYLQHSDIYSGIDNEKCLEVLATNFRQLRTDSSFLSLNYDLVERLLARDDLDCKEVLIMEAALKWFEGWYEKKGMSHGPNLCRDQLLRTFLNKTIRFLLLTMEEFQSHVVAPNLLTPEENLNIVSSLKQMLHLPDQKGIVREHRTRVSLKTLALPPPEEASRLQSTMYSIVGCLLYGQTMKSLTEYGFSLVCKVDLWVKGILILYRSNDTDTYTIVASTNEKLILRMTTKVPQASATTFRKINFDRSIHVKAGDRFHLSIHFTTDIQTSWQILFSINYLHTIIDITCSSTPTIITGLIL